METMEQRGEKKIHHQRRRQTERRFAIFIHGTILSGSLSSSSSLPPRRAGKEQKWQKRDNVFVWSEKKMRIIMWSSIVHHTLIWIEKWFWLEKEQHSRGMNTRRKRNQQQQQRQNEEMEKKNK